MQAALGPVPLESAPRWLRDADQFAHDFSAIPVLAVACAHIPSLLITDAHQDRVSVVGGASIYPTVQNFCLALRSLGVGTAITTFLCAAEPQVRELLAIPDEFLTAAHVAVGYPARPFPRKLTRRPVQSTTFVERFGGLLFHEDRNH